MSYDVDKCTDTHMPTHIAFKQEGGQGERTEKGWREMEGQRERQEEREPVIPDVAFVPLFLWQRNGWSELSSFRKHLERNSLAFVQSWEDRPSKLREQANPTTPFYSSQPFLSIRHPDNSFTLPHFSFATYYHSIMVAWLPSVSANFGIDEDLNLFPYKFIFYFALSYQIFSSVLALS